MTTEQYLAAITSAVLQIAEAQSRTQAATEGLIKVQIQTQETIAGMAISLNKLVDASDARQKRLENLDGLILAIIAEHSNGKNKH